MGFDDDLNACAAIVEKGDPLRFRTVMAAPVAARKTLFPLYAFNVEVSRAPWVTQEPMIAQMRLQWWLDALEEIAAGQGVRRHEVVTPLAGFLTRANAEALSALVRARHWDCEKDPFDDAAHLTGYLQHTSGNLMSVAAACLGGSAGLAQDAGFALGVANWLRACPALEAQQRIPLVDGTAEGVRALAQEGLAALASAKSQPVQRVALPAFWPASGSGRVLKAAVKTPSHVAAGRLPEPSRLGLTLRAAFGEW
ncbi:phytoene synthase [Aliishimia ponticola]|uniref:Phytoene synthase n=1 Tax=Aliishimia ponticola TaxID=2499833 RepID=A0A4S4NGV6_9RHOB|nr:squalene/phytoene synthase family protein [Aliishimia ponticola]THH38896.1 phytoene synthase [Aliishimia ponticola]